MALHFKIKLAPVVATAIVLPILMSLGFWQLDRAEIKQQTLARYEARANQSAMHLTASDSVANMQAADIQYAQLQVSGRYDTAHSFLIDNRVHQSKVGFYVVTPFLVENSKNVILVNRGWIKAKQYRTELPEFSTSPEKISLKGTVYVPSKNFFSVENGKIKPQNFPVIVQNIDFVAVAEILNRDVYPFVLRLEPKNKTGFVRDWKVVTSSPQKSQSYAAQWFTMALVVVLLFLKSSIKYNREKAV